MSKVLYSIPKAILLIICIWERSFKLVISKKPYLKWKIHCTLQVCSKHLISHLQLMKCIPSLAELLLFKSDVPYYNVLCFLVFILFHIYYVDCITMTRVSTMASILNCFIPFIRSEWQAKKESSAIRMLDVKSKYGWYGRAFAALGRIRKYNLEVFQG